MMGSGAPLILLHSGGTSWHDWEAIMPELSRHYTVYAPDFPGCGNSQELIGVHNIQSYTDFVEGFISVIGLTGKKVNIMGMSFGGMTALNFSLAHPDQVNSLILLEVGYKYSHPERRPLLSFLAFISKSSVIREATKWWIYQFGSRGWLLWLDLDTGRDFLRASSRATLETLLSWSELDLPINQLSHLDIPVLLSIGENDLEVTVAAANDLNNILPDSQLLVIPGVSHYDFGLKNLGKGGELDKKILDFLAANN